MNTTEIAAAAGVSIAYVSMVVHGKRQIGPKLEPYRGEIDRLRQRLLGSIPATARPAQLVMRQAFKSVVIDLGPIPKAYIIPWADLHIGSPFFREDVLIGYRDWILESPYAYIVGVGDWTDNNIVGNKASNVHDQVLTPEEQVAKGIDLANPVVHRLLVGVGGNHDLRHTKETSLDLMKLIWTGLGLAVDRYDRNAVFLRLRLGEEPQCEYTIFVVHGWGGARNSGGQVNKWEELAKVADADIFLAGHEHTLTHSRINHRWLSTDGTTQNKRKMFVGCGGFKDYDEFLVSIGRRPPDVGAPRIRLDGTRKDIHVSF